MDGMANPQQLSMAFPVFWSSVSAARCFAVSLRLRRNIHLVKIDYAQWMSTCGSCGMALVSSFETL